MKVAHRGVYQPLDKSTEGIFSVDNILVWITVSFIDFPHYSFSLEAMMMLLCKCCNFCVHVQRGIHAKRPTISNRNNTQGILNLALKSYIQIIYRLESLNQS
ncbi:hypothetical protein NE237_017674 [Protea cynaroides]|uniref:Uncharacterized protein n=1 Tax=Protea cynaroides TaxID=273540 RepID=A0A9Q0K8J2_9MAGN|nr:hypothetical protein NE237_017674 [Protea cynaroides]